jgi:DNA excision repair protein ERCC-2
MLDPKFAGIISKEIMNDSIVAFDNADHVDKFCTEVLTVSIDMDMLKGAKRNMERLYQEIESAGANDEDRLRAEYTRLKNDLKYDLPPTDLWLANPALPDDLTVQPMPGHIRRPEHFLFHLDLLVWYLESNIGIKNKETQTPLDFLKSFYFLKSPFNTNFLKFCDQRLNSLLTTLKIVDTDEFLCIQKLCHFATLWGYYFRMNDEFQITTGPCIVNYDEDGDKYHDTGVQVSSQFFLY